MGVRSKARRHQDVLGDVVAVHHDRPGLGTVLGFVLAWMLMSGLTFIFPGETLVLAIAPSVGLFIIGVVIYVMLAGERLVVCGRECCSVVSLVLSFICNPLRPNRCRAGG